jgi:hypothetical protein
VVRSASRRAVERLGFSYISDPHFDEHAGWNLRKHHLTGHEWISNSRSSIKGQPDSPLVLFPGWCQEEFAIAARP